MNESNFKLKLEIVENKTLPEWPGFSTIWSHSQPLTSTLQCNSALRAEGTGRLAWAALRNMKNLTDFMGKQSKNHLIYRDGDRKSVV